MFKARVTVLPFNFLLLAFVDGMYVHTIPPLLYSNVETIPCTLKHYGFFVGS